VNARPIEIITIKKQQRGIGAET